MKNYHLESTLSPHEGAYNMERWQELFAAPFEWDFAAQTETDTGRAASKGKLQPIDAWKVLL